MPSSIDIGIAHITIEIQLGPVENVCSTSARLPSIKVGSKILDLNLRTAGN